MRSFLLVGVFLAFQFIGSAQTCCSGGIPIAANLGFQSKGANTLQMSLGFEQNRLESLYNEREKLDDSNRLRITNTGLARFAYGINERLDIETLIPYVSQLRRIKQNNGEFNSERGSGIGDITLLAQYAIIQKQFYMLSIGSGLKLPNGANDLRNNAGFLLINDLQLGSNTFDYIARVASSYIPAFRPSSSLYINGTFISRGTNKVYLGSEHYKFGNEIQVSVGYSDQMFLKDLVVYPSLSTRLRAAKKDVINNNLLDNTGGNWLFGRIGLAVDIYKGHRISVNFEIPLYTDVDGTQLSPDYIYNISWYKALDFSKDNL